MYFVDVLHHDGTLWCLHPDGSLEKILTHFHAHNLVIDPQGNLWVAQAQWIQGEIEGEGLHDGLDLQGDLSLERRSSTFDFFSAGVLGLDGLMATELQIVTTDVGRRITEPVLEYELVLVF